MGKVHATVRQFSSITGIWLHCLAGCSNSTQGPALWIPAFAGMTKNGTFPQVVIPAKAGIQERDDFLNGLLDP